MNFNTIAKKSVGLVSVALAVTWQSVPIVPVAENGGLAFMQVEIRNCDAEQGNLFLESPSAFDHLRLKQSLNVSIEVLHAIDRPPNPSARSRTESSSGARLCHSERFVTDLAITVYGTVTGSGGTEFSTMLRRLRFSANRRSDFGDVRCCFDAMLPAMNSFLPLNHRRASSVRTWVRLVGHEHILSGSYFINTNIVIERKECPCG